MGAGVQGNNQTLITDINGIVSFSLTANNIAGEFVVLAEASQLIPVNFTLTNLGITINNETIVTPTNNLNEIKKQKDYLEVVNNANNNSEEISLDQFICIEKEEFENQLPYIECEYDLNLEEQYGEI
jgi:hypothetical protein